MRRSKTKNINIDSNNLILKVKNIATKLIVNNSKTQRKEKTGNKTLQNSKLKRHMSLLSGIQINLDNTVKQQIHDMLIEKAPFVYLLKLNTIDKMRKKMAPLYNDPYKNKDEIIERESALILLQSNIKTFKNYKLPIKSYGYDIFENTGDFTDYTKYGIVKELKLLNIFKLFYLLTLSEKDGNINGGGIEGTDEYGTLLPTKQKLHEKTNDSKYKLNYKLPPDFTQKTSEEKKKLLLEKSEDIKDNKNKIIREYKSNNTPFIINLRRLQEEHAREMKLVNEENKIKLEQIENEKTLKELHKKEQEKLDEYEKEKRNRYQFLSKEQNAKNFFEFILDDEDKKKLKEEELIQKALIQQAETLQRHKQVNEKNWMNMKNKKEEERTKRIEANKQLRRMARDGISAAAAKAKAKAAA